MIICIHYYWTNELIGFWQSKVKVKVKVNVLRPNTLTLNLAFDYQNPLSSFMSGYLSEV